MLYSQMLMDAVKAFNQPVKSTSTTTLKGNEGLDVGSLLMMLMMSGVFNKGKPMATNFPYSAVANSAENIVGDIRGGGAGLASTPNTASMSSVPDALGPSAVPGWQNSAGATGLSQLFQILQSLGKVI